MQSLQCLILSPTPSKKVLATPLWDKLRIMEMEKKTGTALRGPIRGMILCNPAAAGGTKMDLPQVMSVLTRHAYHPPFTHELASQAALRLPVRGHSRLTSQTLTSTLHHPILCGRVRPYASTRPMPQGPWSLGASPEQEKPLMAWPVLRRIPGSATPRKQQPNSQPRGSLGRRKRRSIGRAGPSSPCNAAFVAASSQGRRSSSKPLVFSQ